MTRLLQFACLLQVGCFVLLAASPVRAERADSKKPLDVKSDQMAYDDAKQVSTFNGNVVMVRGTLLLKAGSVKLTQDAAGYQFASLAAGGNSVASFRQKRDGGDFWVEGKADRIEYDGKTELVKFYSRARLTRLEGHLIKDEITGEVITYDSRNEIFSVETNTPSTSNSAKSDNVSANKAKRVTTVIQPRIQEKQ